MRASSLPGMTLSESCHGSIPLPHDGTLAAIEDQFDFQNPATDRYLCHRCRRIPPRCPPYSFQNPATDRYLCHRSRARKKLKLSWTFRILPRIDTSATTKQIANLLNRLQTFRILPRIDTSATSYETLFSLPSELFQNPATDRYLCHLAREAINLEYMTTFRILPRIDTSATLTAFM